MLSNLYQEQGWILPNQYSQLIYTFKISIIFIFCTLMWWTSSELILFLWFKTISSVCFDHTQEPCHTIAQLWESSREH